MANFKDSFAAARKAGKKTFTWNGKKYTTELAEDKPKRPVAKPASATPSTRPTKKPEAMPGMKVQAGATSRAQSAGATPGGRARGAEGPAAAGQGRTSTTPPKPANATRRPEKKPMNMAGMRIQAEATRKREQARQNQRDRNKK